MSESGSLSRQSEPIRMTDTAIYRYSGADPQPSALYPHMCQPGLVVNYVDWRAFDETQVQESDRQGGS